MSATALLAGLVAAALVVAAAATVERPLRRPDGGVPPAGPRPSALDAVGHALARRAGLPDDGRTARWMGAAAAAAMLGALVAPPLAVLGLVGAWVRCRTAPRRQARQHQDAVRRLLPDAVDLLRLCTTGGLSLPLAQGAVAERIGPPLGPALRAADAAAESGGSRADALVTHLEPWGERAAALAHVLADHLRYGVPLAPALERLALELRLDRRRHAEQVARRVPVRLLLPLVLCTLPAFALLTVVPLLGASLQNLPL